MPGWLDMLLEVGGTRLARLRVVLLGGDWVRPELIRGLRKSAPGVRAQASVAPPKSRCTAPSARSMSHWRIGLRFRTAHRSRTMPAVWLPPTDPTARIGCRANYGSRDGASRAAIAAGRPDCREVRRTRRPNLVSDRRSRPLLARRDTGVRRPHRPSGQDQRLPDRTRRSRGGAQACAARRRGGRCCDPGGPGSACGAGRTDDPDVDAQPSPPR